MCLRLTMKVVRTMIATGVWAATSPTAINCEDPAKTSAAIAMAAGMDNPEAAATAP
jgi:hypothetical protein